MELLLPVRRFGEKHSRKRAVPGDETVRPVQLPVVYFPFNFDRPMSWWA